MYISQKLELILSKNDQKILDDQSDLSTRLYNGVISYIKDLIDDPANPHVITREEVFKGMLELKHEEFDLKNLNDSSCNHIEFLIMTSLKKFYAKESSFPKAKNRQLAWGPLFFTAKKDVVTIKGKSITFTVGNKRWFPMQLHTINAKLKYKPRSKNIQHYIITKEIDKYIIILNYEVDPISIPKTNKYIAIDLNHTNLFLAADSDGNSYEMQTLEVYKYFGLIFDKLKKLRDKNHIIKIEGFEGDKPAIFYTSKYIRYQNVILKNYKKETDEARKIYYMLANWLVKRYDIIAIGDYTPSVENTYNKSMRRSMINENALALFRTILEYVCKKYNRRLIIVNENNTTAKCFNCGNYQIKSPEIRDFICPKCHKHIYRDLNSAINIGIKANILNKSMFNNIDLSKAKYKMFYHFHKQKLITYKQ